MTGKQDPETGRIWPQDGTWFACPEMSPSQITKRCIGQGRGRKATARASWTREQLIMGTRREPLKESAEQTGRQKQGAVPTRGSKVAELLQLPRLAGRSKKVMSEAPGPRAEAEGGHPGPFPLFI